MYVFFAPCFAMRSMRLVIRFVFFVVTAYSLASVILIYVHMQWYSLSEVKQELLKDWKPKNSNLVWHFNRQRSVLSSAITPKNRISLKGWWQDQVEIKSDVQCFNQKWALCSNVLTIICKPTTVRSIYQFVPLKKNTLLKSFRLSARATAEQLESQKSDSFFGVLTLVRLNDGSHEFLHMAFPSSTSTLVKEEGIYKVPRADKWIINITVMLACYGYAGTVHFTDIVLLPTADNKSAWNTSSDIIEACPSSQKDLGFVKPKLKHEYIIGQGNKKHLAKTITLVTQISMDRLSVLEHTLKYWDGPVSLVIYVPFKNTQTDKEWQKTYIQKKLAILKLHSDSRVSLVYNLTDIGEYPINSLRNTAIKQANSDYILVVDADFQPSADFTRNFFSVVRTVSTIEKVAFVVPAFEYLESPRKGDGIPRSKEELMQLLHREDPYIQPFQMDISAGSHSITDYWKWYRTDRPYKVHSFNDKYEPYLVLKNSPHLPLYDERFTGYGMNKITHITELFAAQYSFIVLPNVWVIHVPHKQSSYSVDHVQNPHHRLKNRVQRFEFLIDIMRKYRLENCLDL